MTWRRSRLPGSIALALTLLAGSGCGGGEKTGAAPAAAATKITITPTKDARADAKTYLAKLCPKPIGGELNFMVWEGYTDTLFARPFEEACGVKVNATYMGSSDDLVAKLRAGGAETIDLISPSSDATGSGEQDELYLRFGGDHGCATVSPLSRAGASAHRDG